MNENTKCPKCGANIAPEWKHELCPACLMSAGFATGASDQSSPPVKAPDETKASENTYAPPPNAPLSIEEVRKLFPQLEIIEQIGRGGMGVVYKARQPQLDRMVALKILSVGPGSSGAQSNFAERFAREARALAKLNHPNIVSVFDFGQAGDHFYFIMEFVDGANLRQMIASKQITPETALNIVPKVCEALQFAHDEGILHRDIKPENILIDKKGRVKIADFGLAKLVDDKTTDHSLTGTHQVMGTPRYMAPEQFENTKTVDHRADIYSLGVVFYEMLTGEIPMGRFAAPSKKVQVDVRIDEVVLRSLEREPSQRYQHVSEVKTDVENVTHHGVMAPPPSQPKRDGEAPSLHTAPAVAPELRAKINSAGILTVIAGIAVALSGFVTFIYGAVMAFRFANQTGNTGDAAARAAGGAFEMLLIMLCGIAVLISGQAMRRLRFHSFALAMSVVLMALPLVLLLTFGKSQIEWVVFQLVFGVYVGSTTFRLLRKPEVETAFNAASGVPTTGNSGSANFQTLEKPKPGMSAAKILLIVIGVVVGVSALMSGASLLFYMGKQQKPAAVITEDAASGKGTESNVHRTFRYNVSAPANHRVAFWVEYWRDGKLVKKDGLTGGFQNQFPRGAAFEGGYEFSLADGSKTSPDAAGKLRWDIHEFSRLRDHTSTSGGMTMKTHKSDSRGGFGNWITNPFAGLDVVTSWGKAGKWKAASGEPVTLLVMRGYASGENLAAGLKDEEAKQGKACILLRARIDAVPVSEQVDHNQTKTLDAADVEKLSVPAQKPVAGGKSARIQEDSVSVATNKLFSDFRYRVTAPENRRATFWVELWRDGELVRAAGATGGQSYDPPVGKNFDGLFVFSVADSAEWGTGAAGQLIWDFTAESPLFDGTNASKNTKFKPTRSDALSANRKWIGNPFEDLEVRSSWGGKRSWTTIGGEPVTLLMLTGDAAGKAPAAVTDEAAAKRSKVCMLLKVRFDYVLPENLKQASATRFLSADDIDYRGKPAAVPTTDSRFEIAQDRSKVPTTKTAGREDCAFTFAAPKGYLLNIWAEVWRDGRMELVTDLDYQAYATLGEDLTASLTFTTVDGNPAGVESDGMTRLDWAMYSGDKIANGLISGAWRTNLFKGMGAFHRSWDREPRKWSPRPGEVVTILSIAGYNVSGFRSAMSVFTEADLIKGWPNAAIIVRAQFVPAKPGEIRDGQGPGVGINGLLYRIGIGTIPFAQFELAKQLGVNLDGSGSLGESRARLVAAASTKEGQESAVKMLGEFLSEVGYSTGNPDKRGVIEPMNALWWRARKGQSVSADALVAALETFIEDLNTGIRAVWWDKPEPITKGENGPQLSDATAKLLKLTKPQHEEANKIFQKYAQEARALERRNTKIEKNDQGHVLVTISHYSTQCLALASNMVAELGGIVPQNILPAVRPGGLPASVFGSAGECRTEIEMWKADGKYHLNVRSLDWLPALGQVRNNNSFSNVGPDVSTFYGDYRLYWTEE